MTKKPIIFIFFISLLFSCVQERDLSQNTVIAHILSQPDGLHPFNDNSVMRSFICAYTQKTLVDLDLETLEYSPSLLKTLPVPSKDNKSFYFELKDNIRWDDGTQLTGEDIAFTAKLMLCPLTNNAQIRSNYSTVIESVEVDKNNPLKFTMHAQNIHWDNRLIL